MDANLQKYKLICPGNKEHIFWKEQDYLNHIQVCKFVKAHQEVYICGYFDKHYLRSEKKKNAHEVDCPYRLIRSYKKIEGPQINPFFTKKNKKGNTKYYQQKSKDSIEHIKDEHNQRSENKQIGDQNQKNINIKIEKKIDLHFDKKRIEYIEQYSSKLKIRFDYEKVLKFLCDKEYMNKQNIKFSTAKGFEDYQFTQEQFICQIYPAEKDIQYINMLKQKKNIIFINKDPKSTYTFLYFDHLFFSFKIYKLKKQKKITNDTEKQYNQLKVQYDDIYNKQSVLKLNIQDYKSQNNNIQNKINKLIELEQANKKLSEIDIPKLKEHFKLLKQNYKSQTNDIFIKQKILKELETKIEEQQMYFKKKIEELRNRNNIVQQKISTYQEFSLQEAHLLKQLDHENIIKKYFENNIKLQSGKKPKKINNRNIAKKGGPKKIDIKNQQNISINEIQNKQQSDDKINIQFDVITQQNVRFLSKCTICLYHNIDTIILPCMCLIMCQNCLQSSLLSKRCIGCQKNYNDYIVFNSQSIDDQLIYYFDNLIINESIKQFT